MTNSETVIQQAGKIRKANLSEVCAEGFTLILHLRSSSEYGAESVLRQRITDLLNRVEREAKDAGHDYEDIHNAIFALIAFIDETIIASNWSGKDSWLAKPLQLEFFNRFDAGEEFFVRLEKFRQRPHTYGDVLEVYYMCMALGFKGKYMIQEKEQLRVLIDGTYSDLAQSRGRTADWLAPHGRRKEEFVQFVTREVPLWVILVTAFAIGFVVYIALTFFMNGAADNVLDMINSLV
jgi:type VI secretion system protein ImpK